MSFYKANPNPPKVEVGCEESGIVELKRLNAWVPQERDYYNNLVEKEEDYDSILLKFVEAIAPSYEDMTTDDLTEMLRNEDHEEFRLEVREAHPEASQAFNEGVYKLYEAIAIARAKTMLKVRLAQQFEDEENTEGVASLESLDVANSVSQDLIIRLDSFAKAELRGDRTQNYSLFSVPDGQFLDPSILEDIETEDKESNETEAEETEESA